MTLPRVYATWPRDLAAIETGYGPAPMPDPRTVGARQWWTYRGILRSMVLPAAVKGGPTRVLKDLRGFGDQVDRVPAMLPLAAAARIPRPSSWASLYWDDRRRPRYPVPRHAYRRFGVECVRGGWQAVIGESGHRRGPWVAYDIRSAYLAAILAGLPHPWTYRYAATFSRCRPGCWIIETGPVRDAPWPYSHGGVLWATTEDVIAYRLTRQVRAGVTYDPDFLVMEGVRETLARWGPLMRTIARTVWGRWVGGGELRVVTASTSRALPALTPANPIWAHLITHRVRTACWKVIKAYPRDVARVYVDSLLVRPHVPLAVGPEFGSWRLTHTYHAGVTLTLPRVVPLSA